MTRAAHSVSFPVPNCQESTVRPPAPARPTLKLGTPMITRLSGHDDTSKPSAPVRPLDDAPSLPSRTTRGKCAPYPRRPDTPIAPTTRRPPRLDDARDVSSARAEPARLAPRPREDSLLPLVHPSAPRPLPPPRPHLHMDAQEPRPAQDATPATTPVETKATPVESPAEPAKTKSRVPAWLLANTWRKDGRKRDHMPDMPVWITIVRVLQIVRDPLPRTRKTPTDS